MEEILSSIKRIIAEEGDPPARGASRRPPRAGTQSAGAEAADEVLELSDPMPALRPEPTQLIPGSVPSAANEPTRPPEAVQRPEPAPVPEPPRMFEAPRMADPRPPAPTVQPAPVTTAPIVSDQAAAASRGALDQLSRLMVKPEPGSDGSLEGLVREMLRPMLRDWLDAHLPALVEEMVQREIKRITGTAG